MLTRPGLALLALAFSLSGCGSDSPADADTTGAPPAGIDASTDGSAAGTGASAGESGSGASSGTGAGAGTGGAVPDAGGKDVAADSTPSDAAPPNDAKPDASPPAAFSFVVFGDNQFATTSCTSGVPERLAIPKVVVSLNPTLLLEAGDLMDHGYDSGAYAKYQDCYKEMLAKVPFFPTMGNHDAGSGGINNYKAYLEQQIQTKNAAVWGAGYKSAFPIWYEDDPTTYSTDFNHPGDTKVVPSGVSFKTFYAFQHQNAYFISFEQGTRWWTNTPIPWVEKHLKAARQDPGVEHLFVYLHHPFYSTTMEESGSGEAVEPVRKHYEALFRQYDVTMVFSGHVHMYEHFHVPDGGAATRASPPPKSYPHDGKSIHYLITGGGGGPLPNGCNPTPGEKQQKSYDYMQSRACGYHVTQVKVAGKKLSVSVIGVKGSETSHTTSGLDGFAVE
jgi:hypothetical protein